MADKKTMRCYVCDKSDWHNFGKIDPKFPKWPDLLCCLNCGSICYEVDEVKDEAKILDYYRTKYRGGAPTHRNLITTTLKQNYFIPFIREILDEAKKSGKRLVCGDVGAATGYIPAELRKRGHRATGSEYTKSMRRFSEAFYGVPLTEELEPKHKYDLISLYHTLEHMIAPDKRLAMYRDMLAPGGTLLVSVPEWLGDLQASANEPLEGRGHYWHKNHLDCFTRESILNLFRKVGLEVVKSNFITYGQTFLLKRCEPRPLNLVLEDSKGVIACVEKTLEAIDAYMKGDFETAIDRWPRFPEAYINMIFSRLGKDPEGQTTFFEKAKAAIPDNCKMRDALGGWLFQQERFEDAEVVYRELLRDRPSPSSLMKLGWIYDHLGDHRTSLKAFAQAAEMSPPNWVECMELACNQASKMPAWDERALADLQRVAARSVKSTSKLVDTVMEPQKK